MRLKNTKTSYGIISKTLHLLIAVLTISLILLGIYMVNLNYYHPNYHKSLSLHKSLGMLVLFLIIIKIFWMHLSRKPNLSSGLKNYELILAKITHFVLFLPVIIIPITGYLFSTSKGESVHIFNWFNIPAFIPNSKIVGNLSILVHEILAYTVACFVVLHILGAFKHHFIDKDGTLKKMFKF